MSYLNCPRCKLSIRRSRLRVDIVHCPRCIARVRMAVPLYEAPQPERLAVLDDALAHSH
jgi:hypothetical protein